MNTRLYGTTGAGPRRASRFLGMVSRWRGLVASVAWIATSASGLGPALGADDQRPDAAAHRQTVVSEVVRGIEEGQRRLLEIEGGVAIKYVVNMEKDVHGNYVFENPFLGTVRVKWPVLYNGYEAELTDDQGRQSREAAYDFEVRTSIARHDDEIHIVPHRHMWSAVFVYPLRWQCFSTMSQSYFWGSELQTDYWLPEALKQHRYEAAGEETVEGVLCTVLERPGHDVLWVAPQHGYLLCRRDVYFGPEKPLRKRFLNKSLREIAPDVWLPMEQVLEEFHPVQAEPKLWNAVARRLVLQVTDVSVGDVQDSDLDVAIPAGARISDAISGVHYVKGRDGTLSLGRAVKSGELALMKAGRSKRPGSRSVLIWLNVAVLLALLIVVVSLSIRRLTRSRKASA